MNKINEFLKLKVFEDENLSFPSLSHFIKSKKFEEEKEFKFIFYNFKNEQEEKPIIKKEAKNTIL